MKKLLLTLAALLLPLSAHAGNTVVVGASPTPHAEILAEAAKILKKDGYTLKVVEYSDYVQPNMALDSKELDANYFQHKPYLDSTAWAACTMSRSAFMRASARASRT